MAVFVSFCVFTLFCVCVAEEHSKRLLLDSDEFTQLVSRVDSLSNALEECGCRVTQNQVVAFKAHLSQKQAPAPNQRIVFDDVQLNLGTGYHANIGVFIAPVNGTYLFSVSICSDTGHYIVLDLMRNSDMIGRILAGDTQYNDCSSETTVTELTAGDEVYVKHHQNSGDFIQAHQNIIDSFTGSLLQRL